MVRIGVVPAPPCSVIGYSFFRFSAVLFCASSTCYWGPDVLFAPVAELGSSCLVSNCDFRKITESISKERSGHILCLGNPVSVLH